MYACIGEIAMCDADDLEDLELGDEYKLMGLSQLALGDEPEDLWLGDEYKSMYIIIIICTQTDWAHAL